MHIIILAVTSAGLRSWRKEGDLPRWRSASTPDPEKLDSRRNWPTLDSLPEMKAAWERLTPACAAACATGWAAPGRPFTREKRVAEPLRRFEEGDFQGGPGTQGLNVHQDRWSFDRPLGPDICHHELHEIRHCFLSAPFLAGCSAAQAPDLLLLPEWKEGQYRTHMVQRRRMAG